MSIYACDISLLNFSIVTYLVRDSLASSMNVVRVCIIFNEFLCNGLGYCLFDQDLASSLTFCCDIKAVIDLIYYGIFFVLSIDRCMT